MIALIQARMTSTRLPGKVLMDLGGDPLINRVYDACSKACKTVILIPYGDDLLRAHCIKMNWQYREGPEDDVLERYIGAVRSYPEETHFARITSDCPLLSTSELFYMGHIAKDFDMVSNCTTDARDGMEIDILSRAGWEWLNKHGVGNGHREHVTTYVKDNLPAFKAKLTFAEHRKWYLSEWIPSLSIDTAEQMKAVGKVNP